MNFLPCRVDDSLGRLSIMVNRDISLMVPAARIERYAPYKDREMVLGLRPEHVFEYHDVSKPGVMRLDATVDVVEPMGMETMIHFFIDGVPVCARVDPATHAAPGEMLPLSVDMNHMHLMEKDSGRVV